MLKFTNAVKLKTNWLLQKIDDEFWKVKSEFIWHMDYRNKNYSATVTEWFVTNFGSIPWLLRWFFDFTKISYILHDYLYSKEAKIKVMEDWEYRFIKPTRLQADKALASALLIEKETKIKVLFILFWVRLFGKKHFHA